MTFMPSVRVQPLRHQVSGSQMPQHTQILLGGVISKTSNVEVSEAAARSQRLGSINRRTIIAPIAEVISTVLNTNLMAKLAAVYSTFLGSDLDIITEL